MSYPPDDQLLADRIMITSDAQHLVAAVTRSLLACLPVVRALGAKGCTSENMVYCQQSSYHLTSIHLCASGRLLLQRRREGAKAAEVAVVGPTTLVSLTLLAAEGDMEVASDDLLCLIYEIAHTAVKKAPGRGPVPGAARAATRIALSFYG